jgi:hypothetical protein
MLMLQLFALLVLLPLMTLQLNISCGSKTQLCITADFSTHC